MILRYGRVRLLATGAEGQIEGIDGGWVTVAWDRGGVVALHAPLSRGILEVIR